MINKGLKPIKHMVAFALVLATFLCQSAIASHPAVWQLKKGDKVHFLMGTVHMGDASMAELSPELNQVISQVDNLIVEVNMLALSPQQIQQTMLNAAMLPKGQTLKGVISESTYNKLANYTKSLGTDINMFQQFEPWFVGITIAAMEFQRAGYSQAYGVDSVLMAEAQRLNKNIMQLETLKQQVGFLSVFKQAEGEALLLDGLNEMAIISDMSHKLINGYKQGDYSIIEVLYQQTMQDTEFDRKVERIMLTQRNQNWVPKLNDIFKQFGSSLVAVGAMHLIGKNGLVTLLEQQGWQVKRL